jgi:hypothetical protein
VSGAPAERTVLLVTRDLFFRAKLEAVIRAVGCEPVARGGAFLAVVELAGDATVDRIRELVAGGCAVLAFGSHVHADLLRAARDAGAEAVPNSQVESALRRRLAE